MRVWGAIATAVLLQVAATPAAAQMKKPPYWASIASGEAQTRAGPGRNYPGLFLYKRRDLPVKVVAVYENWRRIQDPDGTLGWMLVTLLSDRRTALIKAGERRAIHDKPASASHVSYEAEPGVVGRISDCDGDWCRIEIAKKRGYIRQSDVWGTDENESVK
ncbi:hypothetical protein HMF7854_12795 [Sphingomonas ginkgonis]|uniref:SH3b domain-containing protein n=1 Tax=Sphingomonas ginkgonis TaxID=2315330 RepID=A0A429VCN5_9SPHN|nr:SH3 domain-containing protein [Sphingomonas ginkgonis]RST31612.1 hypothetical protein HMF7854_12795 [Sphingomonas ginkgonis]